MTGYAMLLLVAVLLLRTAPELPLSRFLHEWLARRPAAWLLRRTRREVIAWSIATGLLMFGGEYVLVLGGPHAVLAFAADVAVYVDALIAVTTLASVVRTRAMAQWFAMRRLSGSRPRSKRATKRAALRKPSNDDEDRPALALAA